MKHLSFAAGIAIIAVANGFALFHAARNRLGSPDAELILTNRELGFYWIAADEDSGITLHLAWTVKGDSFSLYGNASPEWLDRQKLQTLGFDCRVNPTSDKAVRFYQLQRPRQTFVALEYDGPAWQDWLSAYRSSKPNMNQPALSGVESRLVAIDADSNASALRTRHPNRSSVMIVPGVVSIALVPFTDPAKKPNAEVPKRLEGRIQQIAASIHVPRPFSDGFQSRDRPRNQIVGIPAYSVHLRYGALLEPYVTGVEFAKP